MKTRVGVWMCAFLACAAVASPAAVINVPADQPTIQAAVTAASPGDTVVVAAGTYAENVVINKQLTLQGAQAGVDARGRVVGAPNPAVESVVTAGGGILFQFVAGSAGTIVDGFAFSGGSRAFESSSGPINGLQLLDNHAEATTGPVVFLNDSGLDITVHQNVFMGSTGSGEVFHLDTDNFDGFHFTSNLVTRTGPAASTGFFVDGNHNVGENAGRFPLFDDNEFTNLTTGMNAGKRAVEYATFSGNNFHDNGGDGLQGGIQHSVITGNTFASNGGSGLALTSFGDLAADKGGQFDVITGNTFTNNLRGLSFSNAQVAGSIATNVAHNNVITGNGTGARYTGIETIDCENNFWGSSSGPSLDGPGGGDAVDGASGGGMIDFTPWLERSPVVPAVAAGDAPRDVVLVNLVGSPALDIATADSAGNTVTILENDGLGGFGAAPVTIAMGAGTAPAALASGDLVAGGGTDLAVACADGNSVKFVDNTGAGFTVLAPIAMPAGTSRPVHLAVCPIDASAPDDVVVALEGDLIPGGLGGLAVIMNGGSATLLAAPAGGFGRVKSVVCADLDGDGDNDVAAVRNAGFASALTTDQIVVYENQSGSLVLSGTITSALDPAAIAARDMDGDGDLDLAVTMSSFIAFNPGGVVIYENDGSPVLAPGNFTAGAIQATSLFPGDLTCTDLLQDSIPGFLSRQDVVAVNVGSGDYTRLIAYAGGTFEDSIQCTAGTNPDAVASADLNGDFTPDVVVANFGSDDVSVDLTVVQALAQPFGTGCPGTGALVPSISGVGLPTYDNPAFGVKVTNARPFSAALLLLSLNLSPAPIGGGCTLYLGAPLVIVSTFTDGSGETTVSFPIPGEVNPFRGVNAYLQYAIFDPAGAYLNTLSFSDALRIKLGH